jgi:hypothetical protein
MKRPSRKRRSLNELHLREQLHGRCDWADCPCRKKHDLLARRIEGLLQDIFPRELHDLMLTLYTMLHCMASHPTNPNVRREAQRQLLSPVWGGVFDDDQGEGPWLH